jgi:hypothetical protein
MATANNRIESRFEERRVVAGLGQPSPAGARDPCHFCPILAAALDRQNLPSVIASADSRRWSSSSKVPEARSLGIFWEGDHPLRKRPVPSGLHCRLHVVNSNCSRRALKGLLGYAICLRIGRDSSCRHRSVFQRFAQPRFGILQRASGRPLMRVRVAP